MKKGSIGEFAKEKINVVFEELNRIEGTNLQNRNYSEEKKLKLKKIINIIGEPIIKNKLQTIYNNCFPNESTNPDAIYMHKIIELQDIIINNANLNKDTIASLRKQLKISLQEIEKLNLQSEDQDD